jgi:antitoxin YefM
LGCASKAKNTFSALVNEVDAVGERVAITVEGLPAAVLMGADDYEALMETIECLSDPEVVAAVRAHRQGTAEMTQSLLPNEAQEPNYCRDAQFIAQCFYTDFQHQRGKYTKITAQLLARTRTSSQFFALSLNLADCVPD